MDRSMTIGRSQDDLLRMQLYSRLHQPGCDPTPLFELLEHVVSERVWERLGLNSLRELIEAPMPTGIGSTVEIIRKLLQLPHKAEWNADERQRMDDLRRQVEDLVTPEAATHGGDRKSDEYQVDDVNSIGAGNSATYLTARLKRDRPDIAERLVAGEFKSVRAAAIEAGIVKEPTVKEQLVKLWKKASDDDKQFFLTWADLWDSERHE